MRKVNYKSNFKLIEEFKDSTLISTVPFEFKYYTKSIKVPYVVSATLENDQLSYTNCNLTEDGRLMVIFNDHNLGAGQLKVQRTFELNDRDFTNNICNYITNEALDIFLDKEVITDQDPCTTKVQTYYTVVDIADSEDIKRNTEGQLIISEEFKKGYPKTIEVTDLKGGANYITGAETRAIIDAKALEISDRIDNIVGNPEESLNSLEKISKAFEGDSSIITRLRTGKQDIILDLESIRSGAAKGANALQSVPSEYITESELDAKNYSTKTYVDNKIADLVNGAPETLNTLDELAGALKDNADIVDVLNESISNKQDKLISGSNIKTINNKSILGSGNIQIEGGSGGSSISGKVSFVASFQDLENAIKSPKLNEIKYYLISDPDNMLPSRVTCYDIPSNVVKKLNTTTASGVFAQTAIDAAISLANVQFQPIGVNVGDLVAFTLIEVSVSALAASLGIELNLSGTLQMYQYKILATNDAKASGSGQSSVGVMGLMSPSDKQRINKVDGIESTANNALPKRDRLPSLWNDNMNNALSTGVYPWCNLGRPSGSTGHFTCIVNRTSTDDGSFDTIEQTAYGREGELGKVYKRIIFQHKNGNETQYGEWVDISFNSSGGSSDAQKASLHGDLDIATDTFELYDDIENLTPVGFVAIYSSHDDSINEMALSIIFGGGIIINTIDYHYGFAKNENGGWALAIKEPNYSERFATKEELSNKVDKPSRNLLINSNLELADNLHTAQKPWSFVGEGSSSSTSISKGEYNGYNVINLKDIGLQQNVNLVEGKTYTVSLMYRAQGTSYVNYNRGLSNSATNLVNIVEGSQGLQLVTSSALLQASFTFVAKADAVFSIYANSNLSIACMQLEEGDTVTKYTRAEDNYATKDEVSTAIANAITNTLNTEV